MAAATLKPAPLVSGGTSIPTDFLGGLVKLNYALVADGCEVENAAFFARVTSDFYPDLEDYYHQQAICWMDEYPQNQEPEF